MKGIINEIFKSIDGEVNGFGQGLVTTFIRLAQCNLNCLYCDTLQAKNVSLADKDLSSEQVLNHPLVAGASKITITGGEPMLQKDFVYDLLQMFIIERKIISIETNGSIEIPPHFKIYGVSWIIDYKLDQSEEMKDNNFLNAGRNDWIKFVIDPKDNHGWFNEAVRIINILNDANVKTNVAFSPMFKKGEPVNAGWLYNAIMELPKYEGINIALNIQIHKILNFK